MISILARAVRSARSARTATFAAIFMFSLLGALPGWASAQGAPASGDGWQTDKSFTMNFLGRDSEKGPDRYHVTFSYGATFFGIAVNSMPLLTADQSVAILMDGYRTAFGGRDPKDIQPGDEFDFVVPLGTIVSTQWKKLAEHEFEYKSLRGDILDLYTNPKSLITYRLIRTEDPGHAEVQINKDAELRSLDLAKAVYGRDDPNFKPDVLQFARARKAIEGNQSTIMVDLTKPYLDDFPAIRGGAEKAGRTDGGLDIYWFRSEQVAQPLFRVDDAVGQVTDPSGLPSLMRVYYYKDGTVRTYQRAEDTVMLAGRQPRNDEWASVFSQYGKVNPAPSRWDIGQPEDDAAAQELNQLGIVVVRYEPKEAPKGNMFTQFLDWLMSLMKRKESPA